MSHSVVVRPAAAADAPELLRLVNALADYEKLDRPEPDARERLLRDAFGPEHRIRAYLAELDGRAVAYAITYDAYSSFLARPTLYLEDVFVLPEARRHGVGAAIFRVLAGEAVAGGYGRMEWSVLDWNELAIGFYEKIGARRLGEWYTYRLTADQLARIADAEPSTG
jgi:GNAT superfamily N-acetyltransferase